jgi:polyisoprenoid-binding protein YceI
MITEAIKTKWAVDAVHSEVQFKVKHLVISTVTGTFKSFDGSFETEEEDFSNADIEFTIDTNSIDTNQSDRDAHLRSADFFDSEKYPKISFVSTSFEKIEDEKYKLRGDLTVKDVTKPVVLDVEFGGTATDFYGNEKAGFEINGKINRKEFGLVWNAITEAGAIVVGDEVKLNINLQFARKA